MARRVVSCRPTDDIDDAARVMAQNRVRRLPVVGDDGRLIGLLTLDDLACESKRNLKGSVNSQLGGVIAEVYGSICAARCQRRHSVDPPRVSSAELRVRLSETSALAFVVFRSIPDAQ
jgi:CBS-domain-containing membrane protein